MLMEKSIERTYLHQNPLLCRRRLPLATYARNQLMQLKHAFTPCGAKCCSVVKSPPTSASSASVATLCFSCNYIIDIERHFTSTLELSQLVSSSSIHRLLNMLI